MKRVLKAVLFFILLLALALFIWTIRPIPGNEGTFGITPNSLLFTESSKCRFPNDFLDAKFVMKYSKSIRYEESGDILITIENNNQNSENTNLKKTLENCPISIEIWVEVKGMLIEPGSRSIEPYTHMPTQMFLFKVTPLETGMRKGTIWIYGILPGKQEGFFERIPFFAIPFAIQVESLFGVPPKSIMAFAFVIILFMLLVLFALKNTNKNRE